jgi:hypothetical protein
MERGYLKRGFLYRFGDSRRGRAHLLSEQDGEEEIRVNRCLEDLYFGAYPPVRNVGISGP